MQESFLQNVIVGLLLVRYFASHVMCRKLASYKSAENFPAKCFLGINLNTVDREIFALKIIPVKIFRVDKFSRFRSIREIFLTIENCNMDERLESLWLLVYYQVSGEPGIARCSHQSDIYLGECGLARKLIH